MVIKISLQIFTELILTTPILAVCAAAIFISTAFVIKLTKPIEYRR